MDTRERRVVKALNATNIALMLCVLVINKASVVLLTTIRPGLSVTPIKLIR
jgi:hypothetical protein